MPTVRNAEDGLPVFDHEVLDSLPMVVDGSDPGFVDAMIKLFDEGCVKGLQAIEAAQRTGDRRCVGINLHSMKAATAQVGAMALSDYVAGLDEHVRGGGDLPAQALDQLHAMHAATRQAIEAHRRRKADRLRVSG